MPRFSSEDTAQYTPTVTYDVRLGELVEYINADERYLAALTSDHVSRRKLQQAPTHQIYFSADYEQGSEEGTTTLARHDTNTNQTTFFVGSLKHYLQQLENQEKEGKEPIGDQEIRRLTNRKASEATVHETRHSIDATQRGQKRLDREVERHRDWHASMPFAAKLVLRGLRLAGTHDEMARILMEGSFYRQRTLFEIYEEEPWEKRARETAEMEMQKFDQNGVYPVEVIFKRHAAN